MTIARRRALLVTAPWHTPHSRTVLQKGWTKPYSNEFAACFQIRVSQKVFGPKPHKQLVFLLIVLLLPLLILKPQKMYGLENHLITLISNLLDALFSFMSGTASLTQGQRKGFSLATGKAWRATESGALPHQRWRPAETSSSTKPASCVERRLIQLRTEATVIHRSTAAGRPVMHNPETGTTHPDWFWVGLYVELRWYFLTAKDLKNTPNTLHNI